VGYRRVHGELLVLGVTVAPSEILKDASIDPAPDRASSTWAGFLRSQADALLACDFLETVTLSGARLFVLAAIEHRTRRIRVLVRPLTRAPRGLPKLALAENSVQAGERHDATRPSAPDCRGVLGRRDCG
jgi:hypothetical protein